MRPNTVAPCPAILPPGILGGSAIARRGGEACPVVPCLGFAFWKQAIVDGILDNLYRLQVGAAGTTRAAA